MGHQRLAAALAALGLSWACGLAPQAQPELGLEDHVTTLTRSQPARDWSHPQALLAVADYLEAQLEAAGARVERQDFEARGNTYRNVRAFLGPREGARLVVGAHYDVAGELPGADDNASGVAVLLEVAERLGELELARPVELVAWTLEEPPFFRSESMGSAVHARALERDGVELLGLINLEMVGYFTDEPASQEYPIPTMAALYPTVGNYLAVVGRPADAELVEAVQRAMSAASELPVVKLLAPPTLPGVDFSDHLNFWARDWSAVMLTDTSFYRNPHYHEPTDTAETLDYERMQLVVEGVLAAIASLAGGPEGPP